MPRIAIVVIGNEILSGKVEEQNAKFAVRLLRDVGADLERIAVVPDDVGAISREVRACSEAFDFVVTSGGVGPTHDDMTYEGVAAAFDIPLFEDPKMAGMLRDYFGAALTADHLRMAQFPRGAEVRFEADIPIPIIHVRNVYIFPGIPSLFHAAFETMRPLFRGRPFFFDEVICALDEGQIAAALRGIQNEYTDLNLGSYPGRDATGKYTVRLTIEGREAERVALAASRVRSVVSAMIRSS